MTAPALFCMGSALRIVPDIKSWNILRSGRKKMSWSKPMDPRCFRASFAERWSLFLQKNYRNAEEASVAYGVRYQTALNWWQGVNRPSGDVVAMAAMSHPKDFTEHFGSGQ